MELERSNVQLNARVANKAEAIRMAGGLLVSSGYMKPGYIDSMMGREKVANTYLGSGIAHSSRPAQGSRADPAHGYRRLAGAGRIAVEPG